MGPSNPGAQTHRLHGLCNQHAPGTGQPGGAHTQPGNLHRATAKADGGQRKAGAADQAIHRGLAGPGRQAEDLTARRQRQHQHTHRGQHHGQQRQRRGQLVQKHGGKQRHLQHLGLGQGHCHGKVALLHGHQQGCRGRYLKEGTQRNPAHIGQGELRQRLATIAQGIERQQIDGGEWQAVEKAHQRGRQRADLRRQRTLRRVAHRLRRRRKQHHEHP